MNNVPTANQIKRAGAAERERDVIRRIKAAQENRIRLPYNLPLEESRVLESKGYSVYRSGGATVIAW